jgi:hypothetical protein
MHLARNLRGPPSYPEMKIESLDLNKAVSYLDVGGDEASWVQFDGYHRAALHRLEASGVDFALIASNTPHHRFASIVRGIGIPVLAFSLRRQRKRALRGQRSSDTRHSNDHAVAEISRGVCDVWSEKRPARRTRPREPRLAG